MSELLPCPFCGGEAELKHNKSWDYFVRCKSCGVRTRQHHENHIGAEMDWNTRAERTCRIAEYDEAPFPVCSECGAVQPDDFTVYYCWNCGAKVVSA